MKSQIYITKIKKYAGTNYGEVYAKAKFLYNSISSKSKRRPYIRSAFFRKEKIFLDLFWLHLAEKNKNDRLRRLRQYACAIDLIQKTRLKPDLQRNRERSNEILYRFYGRNGSEEDFIVQIRENIKTKEKNFMSVFPFD